MRILINATNLSGGGGAQVADSLCNALINYPHHFFIAVLSSALDYTADSIKSYINVKVVRYNFPPSDFKSFFLHRNSFLDELVFSEKIECVFTIFGPMKWRPKVLHVCGFGLSHLVIPESPYFQRMNFLELLKSKIRIKVWEYIFRTSSKCYYTESSFITERVKKLFKGSKVYTVTNYYNQVFDHKEKWIKRQLPFFEGSQLLIVSGAQPHKNISITIDIAHILKNLHPDFKFRFVITIKEEQMKPIPKELKENFLFLGTVANSECPSIYEQCDISFQPTLLECFTATYPEAMRMGLPIITTNLDFAKSLCGDSAIYYEATNAHAASEAVYKVATNIDLQNKLVSAGKHQLEKFDSYNSRIDKLINICVNSYKSDR